MDERCVGRWFFRKRVLQLIYSKVLTDRFKSVEYAPLKHDAGIAQLVEHDLAKVGVASSSLVSRSKC